MRKLLAFGLIAVFCAAITLGTIAYAVALPVYVAEVDRMTGAQGSCSCKPICEMGEHACLVPECDGKKGASPRWNWPWSRKDETPR